MKKIAFIVLFLLLISTQKTYAHVLAADKNIGAVLHVDPNDEPVANEQTTFFFEFKDKEQKFTPDTCDCSLRIVEDGKELYSQSLFQDNINPSLSNTSVTYTFPHEGIYQVKVVGKPLTPHAFQEFTLVWNFRVDQQVAKQSQTENTFLSKYLLNIVIGSVLIIFFLVFFVKKAMKGGDQP